MKKVLGFFLAILMVALLFPSTALAASAEFIISGPDRLETGQTATYTVKAKVNDAAAGQATLEYDHRFFELVSGNPKGEWDNDSNTNTTAILTTVTLKCIGEVGSSGSLSFSGMQVSRLTGGDPPFENVSCSGGSKTVSNPVPMIPPSTGAMVVTATAISYSKVSIAWTAISGARGYQVYRSVSADGGFVRVRTTSSLNYTNTGLKTGTTYYYKVRAYMKAGRTITYGDYSSPASVRPMIASVASATATAYSPTCVRISWSTVAGRSRYEIWRSTSPDQGFALVKSTSGRSYKDTRLAPFVTYYYKVRAYRKVGGTKVYSDYSPVTSAMLILADVTGVKAVRRSATKIKITWRSVSGKSGYEVWRATSADGEYTLVKTTTSRSCTNIRLTTGITYYYKVRAYVTVGGVKYCSGYSAVVSATP